MIPYILIATLQYQFAKDGLRFASPFPFMAIRYSIAALAALAFTRRFRLALNRDTILLSLFTWLSTTFWICGLVLVSPAQSAVLSYTMPLFAIPLSAFILNERTAALGWTGAFVGFVGVFVYGLALPDPGASLIGAVLTVANAFFWALFTIFYRKVRSQDAMTTITTQLLICALLFWVISPIGFSVTITPEFIFDLGYISLLSGLAVFFLWNAMTGIERVGRLTTLIFAVPIATMLVEAVETGVAPGLLSLLGVGVMFLGICISRVRGGGLDLERQYRAKPAERRTE